MNANLAAVLYLVAGVLFILSLRGLSSPASSRQGNFFGMIGMGIAVATTLAAHPPADGIGWVLVILGVAMVGSGGAWARGFGFVALIFASVNIFGGFLVTQRMLAMYKKKAK
jgi:NAD/NADP transhydrogenase beta subunit